MKHIALILAGGKGSRMHNLSLPKQFLEINGKPVVIHTLEVFSSHPRVDAIIVACLEEWIPFLKENISRFGINKVVNIVPGGKTGQDSIYTTLCAAREYAGNEDAIVLVHDAVRPLVMPQTVNENIDLAEKYGNCVTCSPVLETLVVRNNDGTMTFPNRSDAMLARAPQSFLLSELYSAHERALANGRHDFPDSCTLMGYYGHEITTLMDSEENIKITTPTDLIVAETILRVRGKKQTDEV
jgi:2-C-methyl-D-erythritol 4-phosphate cytidylyltransferase